MRRSLVLLLILALAAFALSSTPVFASQAEQQQSQGQVIHVVQPGENLFRISLRYNVSMASIQAANGISNPNLIYVGQRLIIPLGGTVPPPPSTQDPNATTPPPGQVTTYTVQRGDTLGRIATRFATTIQAIAQLNGITNPNLIFVGQVLRIPGGGVTPPDGGTPPPVTTVPPGQVTNYTVQPGDTLARIAARFGTTIQAIAQLNGISNPNLIYVGQVLRIPTSGGGDPVTPPPGGGTPPPPTSGGPFELGGHVASFQYPDQMRGAGMTWAKIQVVWRQGEPAAIAQGAIDAAKTRGFKILLSITGDPGQLAANPTQYYQDFANFLAGVAQLNPDGIEVWNEPNIDRQWPAGQINGRNYTQMLSAAYLAIKNANPNVLVISAAPSPTGFFGGTCQANGCDDNVFLRDMAAAGAASYMDCVGIHYNEGIVSPYARSGDPRGNSSHYTRYYGTMVDVYAQAFPGKQLCFTELGYLTGQGISEPLPTAFGWAQNTTLANQAEWLAGAVTQARSGSLIRLLIIWNVDFVGYPGGDPQGGYAIIRPDNTCPACNTLRQAMGL